MQNVTVSFIVPCYKLAHLLRQCVDSILSQTFSELEVIIMDDCSPDNTPEVAQSFNDRRVKHIRNEPNLGHLRNYNKGIELARGKYIWLISADDYLRSSGVVERYVRTLEKHPGVGYTFCAGIGVLAGNETSVEQWAYHGPRDRIMPGHAFLKRLLCSNCVLAPSGLVRRECYERLGAFPLDMPWAGDWYLWCLFALHYDVGYFGEPMVCYRKHELSMTTKLFRESVSACCEEDVRVPWTIKQKADEAGFKSVSGYCLDAVAQIYARSIATKRYGMNNPFLTFAEFEHSLSLNTTAETEKRRVRARVYAGVGNKYYFDGKLSTANEYYNKALALDPWMTSVQAKRLLLALGPLGEYVRRQVFSKAH
jgi:glycosyltransferase involved in cell wall biosynthesis